MDWKEAMGELVAFVKEVSPELWMVLLRQVSVQIFEQIAWALALILLGGVCFWLRKRSQENADHSYYSDAGITEAVLLIGAGLFWLLAFALIISGVTRWLNPDYYAIKLLINAFTY